MKRIKHTCETCYWWVPLYTPEAGLGECMKHPPALECRDRECEEWEEVPSEVRAS
jgi:hypothetical protein